MDRLKKYFSGSQGFPPDWVAVLVLLGLTVLITWPILNGHFLKAYDLQIAFIRSVSLREAWSYGDLFPRWDPNIIHGYGYPTLNFYAPLFFYLVSLLSFVFPMIPAFNAAIFFVWFASGLAMYLLAREFWGRTGAFVSAVAYLFAPYHILELYVRGTPTELMAFVFLPLLLWAVHRAIHAPEAKVFLAGLLAAASFFLSHNISVMLFSPFIVLYAVFMALTSGGKRLWPKLAVPASVLVGGFLLTAYFWIPAMMEKQHVRIEQAVSGYYDFRQHFLYFDQLLYSPWTYGGSGPGRTDSMSFMIGIAHIVLVLMTLFGCRRLVARAAGAVRPLVIFAFFFAAGVFLTLEASLFVWEQVPLLNFAGFPWRFLFLITLSGACLAGGAVYLWDRKWQKRAAVLIALVLISANVFFCRPFGYEDIRFSDRKDYLYRLNPMDDMEYLPKGVRLISTDEPPQKLQVIAGSARVEDLGGRPLDRRFSLRASAPVSLVFHSYYFPGWEVLLNGRKVEIDLTNPFGLIMFAAPSGEHEVRVRFTTTPVRRVASAVSLAAWGIFLVAWVCRKRLDDVLKKRC
jgi:hypothetical protein